MSGDVKTPEEYFLQQSFWSGESSGQQLTDAEQEFLRKYAGLGGAPAQVVASPEPVRMAEPEVAAAQESAALPVEQTSRIEEAVVAEQPETPPVEVPPARPTVLSVQEQLRNAEEAQLVSFYLSGQEYALPIAMVQEVITFVAPTKLPSAPRYIAGIINLRGRVTPLVRLGELLQLTSRAQDQDRFIVVCKHEGLQIGLIINAVATMYRVRGADVEWNIEARLGVGSQHLAGLLKQQEQLIGIIDVEQLVRTVLER